MKRHPKLDGNHSSLVAGLRKAGCTVQSLASIGNGCPDIVVGCHGINYLFEIKDPANPPSKRRLTDDERYWHVYWKGQAQVVTTLDQAMEIMGLI